MKIATRNLNEATAQQVFDQVANHLIVQGKKSLKNGKWDNLEHCAYRGKNKTQCAAGCLIADEDYSKKYEGSTWNYMV